jgi:hypothetical protein
MVAMRCPTCHRVSAPPAWRCRCGHELDVVDPTGGFGPRPTGSTGAVPTPHLGSLEQIRAALLDRQARAWSALALLLGVDAAAAGGVVYAALQGFIVFSALGFTALILLTARAVQRVRITRASLRQLARLAPALPRAVAHRRAAARRAGYPISSA